MDSIYPFFNTGQDWPVSPDDFVLDLSMFFFVLATAASTILIDHDTDPPSGYTVHHQGTRVWVVKEKDTFDSVTAAAKAIEDGSDVLLFHVTLAELQRLSPLWNDLDFDHRSQMDPDDVAAWVGLSLHIGAAA